MLLMHVYCKLKLGNSEVVVLYFGNIIVKVSGVSEVLLTLSDE